MIAFALATALATRDTGLVISPRVRAMLSEFPLPKSGSPSISIRFSRDTVWLGEQVELVTATWFPRQLRDQLRHQPSISSPSLTGLWSTSSTQRTFPVGSRRVGNDTYDLYVSWQTIFPLGPGRITAPPATLSYSQPTSTAYFAPEVARSFRSGTATLAVRPIPAALQGALAAGPTARNIHLAWRGPVAPVRAGAPAIVSLVMTGEGNLTLWPTPPVTWPGGARVYPEPTLEKPASVDGLISGEKEFRFTIVADSAGVFTLPAVHYPYFDPVTVKVETADAPALTLPMLDRAVPTGDVRAMPVTGDSDVPLATRIVHRWWFVLVALALAPPLLVALRRRPRRAVAPPPASVRDPEAVLRRLLGTPVEAGEDHVVAALRLRGIPRDEAEHVHRWLSATGRRRYGPTPLDAPEAPPVIARVLARLRGPGAAALMLLLVVAARLTAQRADGVARFVGGDYPGAARAFGTVASTRPLSAGAWRDLGTARWMQRDDVGAAAAWLHALALAPRDPLLRDGWAAATTIPPDIRARAPTIPLSRDELLLLALAGWIAAWALGAIGRTRLATGAAIFTAFAVILAGGRWRSERPGTLLVVAPATMRISPHPATAAVGDLAAWTVVRAQRRIGSWVLVSGQRSSVASPGAVEVRGWVPAAALVPIGPLD